MQRNLFGVNALKIVRNDLNNTNIRSSYIQMVSISLTLTSLRTLSSGIPLALHGGRPSSRSSQRSGGPLTCAFSRRPSSGGSRGPLVPASRAGAARAAAILLISCHLQATKGGNKHRRTLSDVAEGSSDGLGRPRLLDLLKRCHVMMLSR